ncbi:uncharacterized protein LOC131235309 [Magnolia sinica]|uniref:uncharacterized protein LOC131235309 n=1 Tax=Magnolia sinica TaxID=86752 RepID=UPI002658A0DC|nr:uncharacterized protein LOC131235309 [Magnolia sinica]XP_058088435.1 uncharacterized protein LOC131235309 [Magnolia sinica]
MGNYISCTLSPISTKNSKGLKVILPSSEIRQFDQPTNAAELMLETPNHFLVNSESLHIGRRFSALAADEDLEMGHVYIMFPMRRVNSVITPSDMTGLFMAANSAMRRSSGWKARILPDSSGSPQTSNVETQKNWVENQGPRLNLEEIEDNSIVEFKARLSMCRSKRPTLETITEETVISSR